VYEAANGSVSVCLLHPDGLVIPCVAA